MAYIGYKRFRVTYWYLGTLYNWRGYAENAKRAIRECCKSVGCEKSAIFDVIQEE